MAELLSEGDKINGRYRIIGPLGRGGGGQVFRAHDEWQSREVALKYLLNPTGKPNALPRFQDEFFKLKQFPHPNIGAGYDFELDRDRKLHFFTTELVPGQNLLDATATLTPVETEGLIVQVLRALLFLHNYEFNHFDVKPHNVLVTTNSKGDPIAKLIDFGVSEFCYTGKLVGTASYMAPEMTTRDFPDHRADLYSLGVMWFHVLARHNPYRGDTVESSKRLHHTLQIPSLSDHNPAVCRQVPHANSIIQKLLQHEREDRFQSAEKVIEEINLHKEKTQQYDIETAETRQSYLPTRSKFVGRQEILKGVRDFLKSHRLDENNPEFSCGPDILLIGGESGFGKTRLLEEMCRLAQPNGFATYGACFDDSDALDRLREKIGEAIDNPSMPTVIWVDDYSKSAISDDIMKLREHLLRWRALSTKPLRTCLVISSTNIEVFQKRPRTEIILGPFTADEMSEYVLAVTGFEKPPQGFVEELRRYTDGRPAMVTLLMRAMLNQGYLLDKAGRWKASTFEDLGVDFAAIRIPEDLVGVIEDEYKQLNDDETKILEAAAAWRRPTTLPNIELLLEKSATASAMKSLIMKGWLGFSDGNIGVTNPVRRDIVMRRTAPQQLARWCDQITAVVKNSPDADLEDVFWYEAHGSDPRRALQSKWQLARHYAATHRHFLAVQILDELGRCNLGALEFDVGILHARSLRQLHQLEHAMGILMGMREKVDDPPRLATLWEELAVTALRRKATKMAEQFCMKGLRVIQRPYEDNVKHIRLENWLGHIFLEKGGHALERAISLFIRTFEETQKLSPTLRIQITNNDLCKALYKKGAYRQLLSYADEAMRLCQEAGETGRLLKINYYKCEALRLIGNYKEAEAQCKSMESITRKYPDREGLFRYYQGLGNIYSAAHRHSDALLQYEHAMDMGGRLNDSTQAFVVTINLGIEHNECAKDRSLEMDPVGRQKHQHEAERILLSALDYLHTNLEKWKERPYYLCRIQLELGDLYSRTEQADKAHRYLDDAEKDALGDSTTKQFLFWIRLTRGEVHMVEGRADAAKKIFDALTTGNIDKAEKKALSNTLEKWRPFMRSLA